MASEVDIQLKNPFTLQNVGPSQELFSWEYSGVGGGGLKGFGVQGQRIQDYYRYYRIFYFIIYWSYNQYGTYVYFSSLEM